MTETAGRDDNNPASVPAALSAEQAETRLRPLGRRPFVAGVCLLLGAAAGLHWAVSGRLFGGREPDSVSLEERSRRAAALSSLKAVRLPKVLPTEQVQAIADLRLPDGEQHLLLADASAGRVSLVWITLFDSDVEDGDAVVVSAGGLSRPLVLTKVPVRLALPMPPDGRIRITGTQDGAGGGITVGMLIQGVPTALAVLSVGQTIAIPVLSE
jgi:hypothetical protein